MYTGQNFPPPPWIVYFAGLWKEVPQYSVQDHQNLQQLCGRRLTGRRKKNIMRIIRNTKGQDHAVKCHSKVRSQVSWFACRVLILLKYVFIPKTLEEMCFSMKETKREACFFLLNGCKRGQCSSTEAIKHLGPDSRKSAFLSFCSNYSSSRLLLPFYPFLSCSKNRGVRERDVIKGSALTTDRFCLLCSQGCERPIFIIRLFTAQSNGDSKDLKVSKIEAMMTDKLLFKERRNNTI